jgi:hypothetical protein
MEYNKKLDAKKDKESKLNYEIDTKGNTKQISLEYNKPAYDKENNRYCLLSFITSRRKPDIYLGNKVIKAKEYKIKGKEEIPSPEDSDNIDDLKKKEVRYFNSYNITIKCFNCNEVGHYARNCPHELILICSKCNEHGHEERECPNKKCFKCNRIGHKVSECKAGDIKRCEKCNSAGHISEDCLSKPDKINFKILKICRFCNNGRHLICPFPTKPYVIEDYYSDIVEFSDEEKKSKEVKKIKKNYTRIKFCPVCAENHSLSICNLKLPDNSFDRLRKHYSQIHKKEK